MALATLADCTLNTVYNVKIHTLERQPIKIKVTAVNSINDVTVQILDYTTSALLQTVSWTQGKVIYDAL
jgi:hypothetical protein